MSNPHTITKIDAFNDNYIWAISDQLSNNIALVDPGDAKVCIDYLQKHQLVLSEILITHHHNDHIGGVKELSAFANENSWSITVYGPSEEATELLDVTLKEGDVVNLPSLNLSLKVLDLPGHTHGHIAYYNQDILFCGDTLFSGGCGRVFEGTYEEMHHSLSKLSHLATNTLVYCAHEYTQANLTFALAVEPNNLDLQNYCEQVKVKRRNNQATIPTNIGLELKINPFLRCHEPTIKRAAEGYTNKVIHAESETFAAIRSWKDNF